MKLLTEEEIFTCFLAKLLYVYKLYYF